MVFTAAALTDPTRPAANVQLNPDNTGHLVSTRGRSRGRELISDRCQWRMARAARSRIQTGRYHSREERHGAYAGIRTRGRGQPFERHVRQCHRRRLPFASSMR